jgi:hypothetical protein
MTWIRFLPLLISLLATASCPDALAQVYQWKDAEGVVHFSDTPPANPASPIEVHPLPEIPPMPAGDDDYYSVVNQAQRLDEQRRQREEARRQAEQQRLQEERRALELEEARARLRQLEEPQEPEGYPVYTVPPWPIWRPGYRRPDWPAYPPDHYPHRPDNRPRPPQQGKGPPNHRPPPAQPALSSGGIRPLPREPKSFGSPWQ